jgi:formylglycine-generating enzyme
MWVSAAAALVVSGALWVQETKNAMAGQDSPPAPQACEAYSGMPPEADPHHGMVRIRAGSFTMGSSEAYPEEGEPMKVSVGEFWIDRFDVTNAQFEAFVRATGYVTLAERIPDPKLVPSMPAVQQVPGSVVFVQPIGGRPGAWRFVPGANWRHPQGPGSDIKGSANHPVIQIAYPDALAYARWLGRDLPTEAQWEYAARGGLERQRYVWGRDFKPKGRLMANTWQGEFPFENTGANGYVGTSPVGCFPANGYGLFDMAGNVWQWTSTPYQPRHDPVVGNDPADPAQALGFDPRQPGVPTLVLKGGSHLCASNYCLRYRPSARQAQEPGLATSHIGFRTVSSNRTNPS